jgi:hypothetical protein
MAAKWLAGKRGQAVLVGIRCREEAIAGIRVQLVVIPAWEHLIPKFL